MPDTDLPHTCAHGYIDEDGPCHWCRLDAAFTNAGHDMVRGILAAIERANAVAERSIPARFRR